MVALGALSYLLQLDGKDNMSDHYHQLTKNFVQYWMKNATVSAIVTLT